MRTYGRLGPMLVAAGLLLALSGDIGSAGAVGPDPDGVIVGIDMDPTGNSCAQNQNCGANPLCSNAVNCTLGPIDRCVSVSAGARVTFDVFLDDLESDSHLGHMYTLGGWPASGVDGTPPQLQAKDVCGAFTMPSPPPTGGVLTTSRASTSCVDTSLESMPDGDPSPLGSYQVVVPDFEEAEYNPPWSKGVLDRWELDTPGAASGLYGLTLSDVQVARATVADPLYAGYPLLGGLLIQAIWDANFAPGLGDKYGLLAIGVPCPGAVGGMAELPDVAQGPANQEELPADGSSPSALAYILFVGGVAALLALTACAWYARRRWGR